MLVAFLKAIEMSDQQFDAGLAMRKQVMGEDFVARAFAGVTDFTAPLQQHITRNAWGDVWQRPGLDLKTRSLSCCTPPFTVACPPLWRPFAVPPRWSATWLPDGVSGRG
jgi:hypothetical protein